MNEQKRRIMETMVMTSKGKLPSFVKLPKEKVYDENGRFIVKVGIHYVSNETATTFVYEKERAFVFTNFVQAKNITKELGGKVIRL